MKTVYPDNGDRYGNNCDNAVNIEDILKPINGKINTDADTDYIKFTAPKSGSYTFTCISGDNVYADLYSADGKGQVHQKKTFDYMLTKDTPYYIKFWKNSGVGEYMFIIKQNIDSEKNNFNIYDFDVLIHDYSEKIREKYNKLSETDEAGANAMRDSLEKILDDDKELHEVPDYLKGNAVKAEDYDSNLNTYYYTKYTSFKEIENRCKELSEMNLSEYSENNEESAPLAGLSEEKKKSTTSAMTAEECTDGVSAEAFSTHATPDLKIDVENENSITYSVTYPCSAVAGNTMLITDFNYNDEGLSNVYFISPKINRSNGQYTINVGDKIFANIFNPVPGGYYMLEADWSTDKTYTGGENSIFRRVHLPKSKKEKYAIYRGKHVDAAIEAYDSGDVKEKNTADEDVTEVDGRITAVYEWLDKMDTVYEKLCDFTGYTPYYGEKITIKSTRKDLTDNTYKDMPDGTNYWRVVFGRSGKEIRFAQPFYRSLMKRLGKGDWGDTPIHELCHDFDNNNWIFDPEALAFLKMEYVMENTKNIEVYRNDVGTYSGRGSNYRLGTFEGSNYQNFLKTYSYQGYDQTFDKGKYGPAGMALMFKEYADINDMKWNAFKKAFRYFDTINPEYIPTTHLGKFNLFISVLKRETRVSFFDSLKNKDRDKAIILSYLKSLDSDTKDTDGKILDDNKSIPAGEFNLRYSDDGASGGEAEIDAGEIESDI